ncbi:hypothetical protein FRB96_008286 [Tulasnella sp. 330]|nr:hypothetical protein FRB96_008286 [Tulasnella sp. 330]KAG8886155.1 hypothetical protein FRB97_007193 [Tulasnella sp. 331]KAG8890443.1 hypothetical protein FRB98_008478 [Tulasnella sp. 332]
MDPHLQSRLYIDMIRQSTGRFPMWDPSKFVKVGDYGRINPTSGEFERDGNIYEDPEITTPMNILLQPSSFPQVRPNDDEQTVFCSEHTKFQDLEAAILAIEAHIDEAMCSKSSLKLELTTAPSQRGAFLVMQSPRTTFLPSSTINMRELAKREKLKEMHLVTEVTECPAYIQCITDKCKEGTNHKIAHLGDISHSKGVETHLHPSSNWWTDNRTGAHFQEACCEEGQARYVPIVRLKAMSPKFKEWFYEFKRRDSLPKEPKTDDDIWKDGHVMWRPLDDDGVEDVFEDTVFDD